LLQARATIVRPNFTNNFIEVLTLDRAILRAHTSERGGNGFQKPKNFLYGLSIAPFFQEAL
jgi:hypothetical protein